MNIDIEKISKMIDNELQEANEKFSLFQSMHEAYGVMREELEESSQEFKEIKTLILCEYWEFTKNDKFHLDNKDSIDNLLNKLDSTILCNICELIQLGAMVRKSKMLNDNKSNKIPKEVKNSETEWFIED